MLLILEGILVVLFFVAAFINPRLGQNYFRSLERALSRLAHKRRTSVFVVGAAALLIRAVLLAVLPMPPPAVHDEFSYLLAADTFAHGRLTNSTHPMWVHFETFHEIQKPTYASMYYPAQGIFLALGQVTFGHPFWGVWLSTGLMCAAICWMLQAWVPPFWAIFGGLLAVLRLGIFSYWMNSYWGGSVAALGGALVLGALPRIERHRRVRDALLMGLGFVIIGNSRPYEGLFFGVAVMAALLLWMRRREIPLAMCARRVLIPLGLIVLVGLIATGFYFWRVTGSPFRTPFQVNIATYNPVPYFPWQAVKRVPHYNHEAMRKFYLDWWMRQYHLGRTHPLVLLLVKICTLWLFFIGFLFSLPLLVAVCSLPYGFSFFQISKRARLLLSICGFVLLGSLLPVYFNPHYAAPVTCGIYALVVIAMQRVRRWKPGGKPTGVALVRSVALVGILTFLGATVPILQASRVPHMATWYSPIILRSYRGDIIRELNSVRGDHLVIVRYDPEHVPITEWVFNDANIDTARIVWARDMGATKNAELISYFKNRQVWLIQPDNIPPKLSKYSD